MQLRQLLGESVDARFAANNDRTWLAVTGVTTLDVRLPLRQRVLEPLNLTRSILSDTDSWLERRGAWSLLRAT